MVVLLASLLGPCSANENDDPPRLKPSHGYMYTLQPFYTYVQNSGPWHAFYAITPYTYFNIKPTAFYGCFTIPKLISTAEYLRDYHYIEIGPLKGRKRINPKVGRALALRMIGIMFTYRAHRCNCPHYTDYLLYGTTYGTPADITYQTISADCPLYYPLTSKTNVWDEDFTLQDYYGNKIKLGKPPQKEKSVRRSRSRSKSGSRSGSESESESGSESGSDSDAYSVSAKS
ncbi:unnamed protein product [Bemisia tabaci]|uniref:Uncharacterized protein n=2 Tax=Bemisia tabaci TaxID=7038 RepID=A0A9P0CED4_BEMTA|nr:unnamed protein product [Bemisia tabaci]